MKITHSFLALCSVVALGVAGLFLYRERTQTAVVLQKIVALEARLAINNQQGAREMANRVYGISVAVSKNNNMARDVAVLHQSQQVLHRAKSITDTLRAFQQALRVAAHEASSGTLPQPDADAPSRPVRITPQQLARQLARYTTFIRAFVPDVPALTQTASEDTTWLYGAHAPVAAARASLTRLEGQVRRQAMEALNREAQKVGSGCCMCFDKIGAMAVPVSNTVAPGATYEAQLFLTQAASSLRPVMTAAGRALAEQPNGRGVVEIRVPPPRPGQPDTVRARWRGTIQVKTGLGDTTFQVTVPYFIVKQPAR